MIRAAATARTLACALLAFAACGAHAATPPAVGAATDDFVYSTRAGDTLIGIAARLLREPARWPALQSRNAIRDPRRMPIGTALRIPHAWLRTTSEAALVTTVTGRATLDGRPLAAGERAPSGATIETADDGAVTLELADGSAVTLQKSGALSLERLDRIADLPARDVQLHLRRGRMDTRAKPQTDGSRFRIRTAVAVSAVRGTEFRTAVVPPRAAAAAALDGATTETLEGAVAVASPQAAVAHPGDVLLARGFGTRVDAGAPPLPPVRLLPAPDLGGLPARNEHAALAVAFAAVPGARSYRVQLARDADFRAIVGDVENATPEATFADLPDGAYWLRARAIDAAAIEGIDAIGRLEQRLAPPPAPPPAPVLRIVADTGARTQLAWQPTPGATWDVQVARDAAFTQLVWAGRIGAAFFEWPRSARTRSFVRARGVAADGTTGEYGPALEIASRSPW